MKPWGPLEWILAKTPRFEARQVLLACVGAEDRSVEVPRFLRGRGFENIKLFKVNDPPSRYLIRLREKTELNMRILTENGITDDDDVQSVPLFASDEEIAALLRSATGGEGPVELWLDITSMPKRFFFLLVKLALVTSSITSIFVTYAQPAPGRYTREHLSEDPEIPQPLPGFGPSTDETDRLIVAVGFEPLGLSQLLGDYREKKREIFFLVPFPPGQPYSRRVWETIRNIGFPGENRLRRIPALDAFATIETVRSLVGPDEGRRLAFAPYGPKPMSLGMCVYAATTGAAVFYTQPRVYHPDYTVGVGSTWAYCLRLLGRDTCRPADSNGAQQES
jgi:hypothetical protein